MAAERNLARDAIAATCLIIELHAAQLMQLFSSIDPSPFRDMDLDPSRSIHRRLEQGFSPGPAACGYSCIVIDRLAYRTRPTPFMGASAMAAAAAVGALFGTTMQGIVGALDAIPLSPSESTLQRCSGSRRDTRRELLGSSQLSSRHKTGACTKTASLSQVQCIVMTTCNEDSHGPV